MKKLAMFVSFALILGVLSVNAQDKKPAVKPAEKPKTEAPAAKKEAPAAKKETKKVEKKAHEAKKDEKKAPAAKK